MDRETERNIKRLEGEISLLQTEDRLLRERIAASTGASGGPFFAAGTLTGTLVAGDGIAGGGTFPGTVTVSVDLHDTWSGLEFDAGELRVDQDPLFTWTSLHTFQGNIAVGVGTSGQIYGIDDASILRIYSGSAHTHSAYVEMYSTSYATASKRGGFFFVANTAAGTGGSIPFFAYDGASTWTQTMLINAVGDVAIGNNLWTPLAQLHVDQTSASGGKPALLLDQAHTSEQHIVLSMNGADQDFPAVMQLKVTGDPTLSWDESESRLVWDEHLGLSAGDLHFASGYGIVHADGVAAGWLMVADGTRYVPSNPAASFPIAPGARGHIIRAEAGPVWASYDAKAVGSIVIGDGTDVISTTTPVLVDLLTSRASPSILFDPITDQNHTLFTVNVTGTPAMYWREALDSFLLSHDLTLSSDLVFTSSASGIRSVNNAAGRLFIADGTRYKPAAVSGDLTLDGTGIAEVVAIRGYNVQDHAPLDGEALIWSVANSQYEPGEAGAGLPTPTGRGYILRSDATPEFVEYNAKTLGAVLIGDGTDIISDTTPTFVGDCTFQAVIDAAEYIRHDGDWDTYLRFRDDRITLLAGSVIFLDLVEDVSDYIGVGVSILMNGNLLVLDVDDDSYLYASADDVIDLVLAGAAGEFGISINSAEDFTFTANAFNVLVGSTIVMGDDTWIGLGAAAGRISFDNAAIDVITVSDANLIVNAQNVAIGPSASIDTDVGVYTTKTSTDQTLNTLYGLYARMQGSPAGTFQSSIRGVQGEAVLATAQTQQSSGLAYVGVFGVARITNGIAGTLHRAYGGDFHVDVEDGTVLTAVGVLVETAWIDTGTVTNGYGIKIEEGTLGGGATLTTQYGLYIDAMDDAVTDYAIYTNNGKVRFGDLVDASVASVRLEMSTTGVTDAGPTDAELDGIFGTPATVGSGFFAFVDDGGAHARIFGCVSDGTNWWWQRWFIAA